MEFKFKVGDRVKVTRIRGNYVGLNYLIGNVYTITSVSENFLRTETGYILEGLPHLIWYLEELELVKPKFNYADYAVGKYAIHCKTIEQAEIFNRYCRWYTSRDYSCVGGFDFMQGCHDVCFNLLRNTHSSAEYYERKGFTILEFEDFDWSDFEMNKKEFTKADLKNGDVIKYRNGCVGIVILETNTVVIENNEFMNVSSIADDLTNTKKHLSNTKDWDIVAVRRPMFSEVSVLDAFDACRGDLIYERKEVEEMTLEEVCKALGKEIKIVKG